jgi:hypothetical protein
MATESQLFTLIQILTFNYNQTHFIILALDRQTDR